MRGSVRSQEKCPVCGNSFQAVRNPRNRDTIDLVCPDHQTRPLRFFIDGRHLWYGDKLVGYMFRGFNGKAFGSFEMAQATLVRLRKGKTIIGKYCEVCGERDPDVIHEHHIVPKNNGHGKQYDRQHGEKVMMCANCHFKAHSVFGGYRYKAYTGPLDRKTFIYKMREIRGQYTKRLG